MSPETAFVLLLALFLAVLVLCVKPLGSYIADIMEGRPNFASRLGGRLEALIYRICGIEPGREMAWSEYAIALLLFNVLGRLPRLRTAAPAGVPALESAEVSARRRRTPRSTPR